MSQTIARSTVFLDEMGVGVQWKLRNPPVGEAAAVEDDVALEPVVVAAEVPPPSPEPVAMPTPAPMPVPVPTPVIAAEPTPAPSFAPEPPAAEEPLAMADEDSNAWFDEAPVPARAEPVSDAAIAAMDWAALKTAVSTCTRCALCDTRRNAVNGRGAADASWIAIAAAPSRLDEKENQAIAGEAGQLLDNMLKAISLKPEADVYVTNLVKCRPSGPDGADRAPSGEELLACRPFLERELALTSATMAMTFGQYAAKGLMMGPAARGQVMRYGAAQLPVVATYHPDDLLRRPEDKAKAWGDLCLAKAARD
ncbi:MULTISPECIES: uracil-DNA glycosylase [unclassified Duganella]|uniref:uracil-DNA glycosylase n=1 Tax=unclassified Duganella TaxID=2636909 RepID=UPI000E34EE6D|nr:MULTISPECIES: uracil-DNA glycosylase [unclassified Duganella]RFP16094.1 uracil-DNA glycosylase [Duganella sp. BJB475]RFP32743.1 uracil-DNA glycosylase [Duganella sp. BJB476]